MWFFYIVLKIHSFHQNVKQCHHFPQERIELSENDDEEKRRWEEIDWLGWFFLWWNELLIFQRQTRSIFYFCTFMPNLSIPGTFYNDNQRIEVINGKKKRKKKMKIHSWNVLAWIILRVKKLFQIINCLNSLCIVLACTVPQKNGCFFLNHYQNVVFI